MSVFQGKAALKKRFMALTDEGRSTERQNLRRIRLATKIVAIKFSVLGGAFLVALSGPVGFAQQPVSSTTNGKQATINQRKHYQQNRIANGIANGQLTSGEAKNLETKEAGINREERLMREEDQGSVTKADRAALNQQQNQLSKQIYADRHNSATAHYGNGLISQRRENQQDRIAQGIRSGQLTPGEAARTQRQEHGLNREIAGMRQANGGKLSQRDRRLINHQQNQLSRKIYTRKHNSHGGF
jgi:hypothetical protein